MAICLVYVVWFMFNFDRNACTSTFNKSGALEFVKFKNIASKSSRPSLVLEHSNGVLLSRAGNDS